MIEVPSGGRTIDVLSERAEDVMIRVCCSRNVVFIVAFRLRSPKSMSKEQAVSEVSLCNQLREDGMSR